MSFLLLACSSSQVRIPNEHIAWVDAAFEGASTVPVISKDELFRLDEALKERLTAVEVQKLPVQKRVDYLLNMIFGSEKSAFTYLFYNSGSASETWNRKKGDCISLTILAYAIGRELNLPILMQKVEVPVQFDRQGQIEYFNTHVNAIILDVRLKLDSVNGAREKEDLQDKLGYIAIDFDPNSATSPRGHIVNEKEILALFYNNIAANYLSKNDNASAYAYFKAAITAAPTYSPSFSNLAQVYQRHNLVDAAEKILKQSILVDSKNILAVRELHRLLIKQKRWKKLIFIKKYYSRTRMKNHIIGSV